MKLGIVGAAAEKFTPESEARARRSIAALIEQWRPHAVVSGRSPMGGVDVWAEEEAVRLGVPLIIYPARHRRWGGDGGFRDRNLRIAQASDLVAVVVVRQVPPRFSGMQFDGCYHCRRDPRGCHLAHVKSGGCWTGLRCKGGCAWRVVDQVAERVQRSAAPPVRRR